MVVLESSTANVTLQRTKEQFCCMFNIHLYLQDGIPVLFVMVNSIIFKQLKNSNFCRGQFLLFDELLDVGFQTFHKKQRRQGLGNTIRGRQREISEGT